MSTTTTPTTTTTITPSVQRPVVVDNREGSMDLLPHLRSAGLEAEPGRLEFGDLFFTGSGPRGVVRVGVEVKKLRDLLNSMRSGRLMGHQLPGMSQHYDFVFLLVEGVWREGDQGMLEEPVRGGWREVRLGTSGFLWREVEGFLNTAELVCGVRVRRSQRIQETAAVVKALHHWFGKEWREHGSHRVIYSPPPDQVMLYNPSVVRRVAKELPGVGWDRSGAIESRYKSVVDLCCASWKELAQIPGIGEVTAKRVVRALNGLDDKQSSK